MPIHNGNVLSQVLRGCTIQVYNLILGKSVFLVLLINSWVDWRWQVQPVIGAMRAMICSAIRFIVMALVNIVMVISRICIHRLAVAVMKLCHSVADLEWRKIIRINKKTF